MAGRLGSSTATLRRTLALAAAAALLLLLAVAVGTSPAAKLRGTNHGEKIVGTKGADKIKGMSGNDKIKGKKGNDKLNGGKGRDTLTGDKGADKMLGGAGNDVIKAADGRRDKAINGGGGKNRCVIDTTLELSIARNCSSIIAGVPVLAVVLGPVRARDCGFYPRRASCAHRRSRPACSRPAATEPTARSER